MILWFSWMVLLVWEASLGRDCVSQPNLHVWSLKWDICDGGCFSPCRLFPLRKLTQACSQEIPEQASFAPVLFKSMFLSLVLLPIS